MAPEIIEQFVDYFIWCKHCEYKEKNGWEDPCNECMNTPVAINTTKPVNYVPKKEETR